MTMEDLTRLSNKVQFPNWRHIQTMLYSVNKTHQSWLQFRLRWSWSYLCSEGYDGNKCDDVLVKFSLLIWSVVRFYHKSNRTRNDFTLNAASPVQFWHEAAGHSNVVFKKGTKKQTENWKNFLSVIRLCHAKINTIQNSVNITACDRASTWTKNSQYQRKRVWCGLKQNDFPWLYMITRGRNLISLARRRVKNEQCLVGLANRYEKACLGNIRICSR